MRTSTPRPIKDYCIGIYDGPHATPKEASDGPIFLGIKNITDDGHLDLSQIRHISEEEFPRWTRRVTPQADDIVFTYEATLHRYAIIPKGFRGCLGRRVALVRPDPNKVDSRYLLYYFMSHEWRKVVEIINGATVDRIPLERFPDFPIALPSLSVQRKITTILSIYNDLIENNQRRMALLEESVRLLYQEWFIRLRFPGHEHTRIIDGVPEGWENKTLGELADVTMGQSPESKYYNETGEGLPFHQGVADFGNRFVTDRVYTTAQNRVAYEGSILCSVRAPVGRLNITLNKIVIGRGLSALRSLSGHQSFLFYQMRAHFFKEDMIGSGAIFASVTKTEFENQKLLSPPNQLVQAFEEISVPIDNQLRMLFFQNQKLRSARDLLLPRLMSGEITV
ncbi:MAG: restriction endonuclease subunit S [bacterium]